MGQTSNCNIPYPDLDDVANIPNDLKNLAETIDVQLDKINTQVIIKTDTDLNDYVENGVYYFESNVTPVNIPVGSNGFLKVIKTESWIKQIWYRTGTLDSNDYQTYVRTSKITNKTWSNWQQFAMQNKKRDSVTLWSGSGDNVCNIGDTVTLSESIKNFSFVLIKGMTNLMYLMCPIISSTSTVRGTNSYATSSNIELVSVRGTCANTSFKLDALMSLAINTSGITNKGYTYISEIIGIR